MDVKEGQYYYAPHRRSWGVWKKGRKKESGVSMDDFVSDFSTKIQAQNFCKKMNLQVLESRKERFCGECPLFKYEDTDGYGICSIDNMERRCSDVCAHEKDRSKR